MFALKGIRPGPDALERSGGPGVNWGFGALQEPQESAGPSGSQGLTAGAAPGRMFRRVAGTVRIAEPHRRRGQPAWNGATTLTADLTTILKQRRSTAAYVWDPVRDDQSSSVLRGERHATPPHPLGMKRLHRPSVGPREAQDESNAEVPRADSACASGPGALDLFVGQHASPYARLDCSDLPPPLVRPPARGRGVDCAPTGRGRMARPFA